MAEQSRCKHEAYLPSVPFDFTLETVLDLANADELQQSSAGSQS